MITCTQISLNKNVKIVTRVVSCVMVPRKKIVLHAAKMQFQIYQRFFSQTPACANLDTLGIIIIYANNAIRIAIVAMEIVKIALTVKLISF